MVICRELLGGETQETQRGLGRKGQRAGRYRLQLRDIESLYGLWQSQTEGRGIYDTLDGEGSNEAGRDLSGFVSQ